MNNRVPDDLAVSQETYPYDEGDVVVLGPEIFASKDGEVINWKGRNFVPQTEPYTRTAEKRREIAAEILTVVRDAAGSEEGYLTGESTEKVLKAIEEHVLLPGDEGYVQ